MTAWQSKTGQHFPKPLRDTIPNVSVILFGILMYFVVEGLSTRGFPYSPVNIIIEFPIRGVFAIRIGLENIIIIRNIEITSNV